METKTIDEKKLEEQFEGNQDLRNEFGGDLKAFLAFSEADANGLVGIFRGKGCLTMTAEQFGVQQEESKLNEKISANENELRRLSELQRKNESRQYQSGVACQV